MKRSLMLILLFLMPAAAIAQVPEWQCEVVVKADYGDEKDEYGFEGITERTDTSPVIELYITSEYVYICDGFQANNKVYDLSGKYIRTISTKWSSPHGEVRPPAEIDLLVHDGVIYLLCERGSIPPPDQTAIVVITYDLETGERLAFHELYNPLMGRRDLDSGITSHANDLRIGPNKGVWIYDYIHHESYPLIRDGKAVPRSEHTQGVPYDVFGQRRIAYNEEKGGKELLNSDGTFIRDISVNDPISSEDSSSNGEYFLKWQEREDKAAFIITTWDGRDIGRVEVKAKKTWYTYSSNAYKQGPDGRLYHVFADYDGVYLFRCSN